MHCLYVCPVTLRSVSVIFSSCYLYLEEQLPLLAGNKMKQTNSIKLDVIPLCKPYMIVRVCQVFQIKKIKNHLTFDSQPVSTADRSSYGSSPDVFLNPGFKADKLQASVTQFAGAPFHPKIVTSAQIRHTKNIPSNRTSVIQLRNVFNSVTANTVSSCLLTVGIEFN